DDSDDRPQRLALADDVLEAVARLELALELAVRTVQAAELERLLDQGSQTGDAFVALLDEPERARIQRLDRVLGGAEARDHDAHGLGRECAHAPHERDAVHAGHLEISQYEVEGALLDPLERRAGIAFCDDRVTLALEIPHERR